MYFEYKHLVELCKRTKATKGLDTSIDRVVEYQDMIGHSTENELADLSNSEYKKEFYWIYSTAYRIEDTINFYVNHSEKIAAMVNENIDLKDDLEEEKSKNVELSEKYKTAKNNYDNAFHENAVLKTTIEMLKSDIINLKAKLYDLSNK